MPDHTIAENLARLQAARTNISTAIATKGGTVPSGAGFEDFPTAIASIPEGTGDHDLFGVPATAQNPKLFTATFTTTGTTAALAKMAEYWPFDEITQDGKYYWGEDNYFTSEADDRYVYAYNGSTYLNYFGSMSGESGKTVVIGENFFLGIFSRCAIFCGYAEDEDGLTKKCIGLIPYTQHSDPVYFALDDGERILYPNQYYGSYGSSNAFNQYTKILYGATKYTVKDLQIMLTWQYRPTDPGAECTIGDDQAYLYSSIAALAKTPTAHAAPPIEFESDGSSLKNWVIFGADPGVGERTKNLFDKSATHTTGAYTDVYIISGLDPSQKYTCSTSLARVAGATAASIYFSQTTSASADPNGVWAGEEKTFTPNENGELYVGVRNRSAGGAPAVFDDIIAGNITIMVNAGSTTSDFEPYGYKIPVETRERSGNTWNVVHTTNIYTQTQLGTGDTITKEQTGVDIPTVDGENCITVATTTQPAAMTIAYAEPE